MRACCKGLQYGGKNIIMAAADKVQPVLIADRHQIQRSSCKQDQRRRQHQYEESACRMFFHDIMEIRPFKSADRAQMHAAAVQIVNMYPRQQQQC